MAATIEQVTQEALTLSDGERARLAHTLLLSLDGDEDATQSGPAWEAEIARRLENIENGTALGRSVEEVFSDIRERYQ